MFRSHRRLDACDRLTGAEYVAVDDRAIDAGLLKARRAIALARRADLVPALQLSVRPVAEDRMQGLSRSASAKPIPSQTGRSKDPPGPVASPPRHLAQAEFADQVERPLLRYL